MLRHAARLRIAGLGLLFALLAGCGGGGGGTAAPPAPPPAAPPPVPASIASFSAVPAALNTSGGPLTLTWQASNAGSYAVSVQPSFGVGGLPAGTVTGTSLTATLPVNAGSAAVVYTFTLTANGVSGTAPATAATQVTVVAAGTVAALTNVDWPAQVIYFLMTDRFDNGNTANDNGGPGDPAAAQPQNPMGWYGGDFQGVTGRINAGYLAICAHPPIISNSLYINTLRINFTLSRNHRGHVSPGSS